MRISLTALTPTGAHDVVASGDDTTTVAVFAEALEERLSGRAQHAPVPGYAQAAAAPGLAPVVPPQRPGQPYPQRPPVELWVNGRRLDPRAPVTSVLRDGDIVAFDPQGAAATWRHEPTGAVEVRISSGPSAGTVARLGFGAATIGSAPGCTIPVSDPHTPPHAATVHVTAQGATIDPVPGVHITLDGVPLSGPAHWRDGGVLIVGASVFTLRVPEAPDAHLTPMPDGGLAYNRPPRLTGPSLGRTLEVPAEPRRPENYRLQLLSSMVFAVGGVVMAIVFKQPFFLLMTLLAPLSMVAQWWSDRRYGRKRHRQAMKEYRQRRAEFVERLEQLRQADQAERRAEFPDPAEVLLTATGPRRRLWERRIHDADTLHLRLGLADLPSRIEFTAERAYGTDPQDMPPPPISHAVPVTVALPKAGVMGITGLRQVSRALGRWLVAQAAALHSPRDLAIVVLSADKEAAQSWNWVRWLPHCAPHDGEDCVALVGADPDSTARRIAELLGKINERRAAQSQNLSFGAENKGINPFAQGYATQRPYNVLVVLDGARALRGMPGMPQVLQLGPTVGVYAICIDDDQRLLPEECTTVAVCAFEKPGLVRLQGHVATELPPGAALVADQVSVPWCDRAARAMGPLRDVSRDDADSVIPTSARLLDLLNMPDPRPEQIQAYWRRGRTTRVPIGIGAEGPFSIDLRLDGPHGLVAGTTGAGKSELLQSLIASLAVANRPDEMNFVLIDYKGGSAFKDCAKLPHTVGMVSDLDGHLTERALESLAAELKRREHMLLNADAKDIEDYNDLRDAGEPLEPMPRLLLIIDEFAAMVQELPDFVVGLVDIARRGRSLGVHLILATQRPAGVVTPDIAANTNLRISLRVTSAEESHDVINSPNAVSISKTTPGRCYVRSGASSLHMVQSARIGGRRPGSGPAKVEPVHVVPLEWQNLGAALPAPPDDDEDESTMVTDLAVLVDAISAAARRLGIDRQRSPWLPPLPESVTLRELPVESPTRLPFGLADIPSEQRRAVECYDLSGGHLLVCGASRSGRSTALRAIAGAVGAYTDPRDVHLYAVDCGNNALLPLVRLPHTGAVVGRDSPDRLSRLTDRLLDEIARRQQTLAAQGFADVTEQRAVVPPEQRMPYLLVLFDRWEGFMAAFEGYDNGRLVDQWLQILQEGSGAGVKVVMSGDRSTLVGRISTQFDDRLVLKLTDVMDYTYVGMKSQDVPEHFPPGRAFRAGVGLREVQVALLAEDPAGTAQVSALHEIARMAKERVGDVPRPLRPFRVDALPPVISLEEALRLDDDPVPADAVVFGVGGDSLGLRYFRAEEHGPGLVIAGPPKTGRSTALCTIASWLLGRGYQVALITPRRSPLRDLAGRPGVLGSFTADDDAEEVKKAVAGAGRHALVIDDLELLGNDSELAEWVTDYVGELRDTGNLVIGAGSVEDLDSMYRGPVVAMKKSRNGLLLRPTSTGQGDLLGVRLPRSVASGAGPVGRGLLVLGGQWEQIQVAHP